MESVKYILGLPETVDDIEIHPIKIKHYDEFMNAANVLTLSYEHFNLDELKKEIGDIEVQLFDLLFMLYGDQKELFLDTMSKIFSFVCREQVNYEPSLNSFIGLENGIDINKDNYEKIREIILKQNLIFTPKVYKNKVVQEWVELAIKARAQSSLDCTIEDMITTIVAWNGMDINILKEQTIYQVKAVFYRILKIQDYQTTTLFQTVDTSGKLKPKHFAESIDMLKSPYDDVIKEEKHYKHIKDAINGKY